MSIVALLTACHGDKDLGAGSEPADATAQTADSEVGTDVTAPCGATVASINPASGDVLVPLDRVVTVAFDESIASTDAYAISIDGVAGATVLANDGLSMTFAPDAPFAPDTAYTVAVEVCADADSAIFTTQPEVSRESVEGNSYALRWADVAFTEPGNPEALSLVPIDFVLLQIETADLLTGVAPSAVAIGFADAARDAVPDCDTVVEEDADFSSNPYYAFEGDLQITLDAGAAPPALADLEEFRIYARVATDGESLSEITLSALVAPEQFVAGLDCGSYIIQALLPSCLPCTISDTGQCMLLEGTADGALVQLGLDLVTTCGL